MSKTILGLRTTIYKVADLPAAIDWYSKTFQTEPYFNEPFYVGFEIAGYELGLLPEDTIPAEKADTVLTYWGVENIQAEFDHFISAGATVHEEPTNVGGDIVTASVKDPWGNIIGLIYNPEFKLP